MISCVSYKIQDVEDVLQDVEAKHNNVNLTAIFC